MATKFALIHNQKITINDGRNQEYKKNHVETAVYMADMLLELRNMAKDSGFSALQGLLEIAYYEAFSAANRINISAHEFERLKEISQDAKKAATVI